MNLGGFFNDPMSSLGIGNDFIADSPIGSFLGMAQNKEAKRQFNTSLDWQKYQFNKQIEMMNNAHQREIADLEKAGLNPVLSANGSGLGTPTGLGTVSPTAHMDSGSAGLNFITGLLGNIANMKNAEANLTTANAVDKKATAESSYIDTQKRILGYSENYSRVKGERFEDYIRMELNKDPRNTVKAIAYGFGDLINELANKSPSSLNVQRAGQNLETFSEIFDSKQVRNVIDTISIPNNIKKNVVNLLKIIRIFTAPKELHGFKLEDIF